MQWLDLALAADGYEFILKRSRHHGSDVFRTRLMLQPFLCMTGEEAARVFTYLEEIGDLAELGEKKW